MTAAEDSRCTGCSAPIRWVLTEAGKRMPIDPEPHPDGTVVPMVVDGKRRARVLGGSQLPAQQRAYRAHWVTCPASADFKRRKAATTAKCRACGTRMDPWLPANGWRFHIGCAPPDLRTAIQEVKAS